MASAELATTRRAPLPGAAVSGPASDLIAGAFLHRGRRAGGDPARQPGAHRALRRERHLGRPRGLRDPGSAARHRAAARRRRRADRASSASAPPGSSPPTAFPAATCSSWALALPLAFPTYIVAYVYVDLFDAFGPVQNALLALTGWRPTAGSWYPNIRSLPGAIFVFSLVLYPYVFLAARAMFQTQSACLFEVARTLGATRFMLARHVALPLARPALAVGLSLALMETLNDIGACGISRRAHADALDLHHLAQPLEPARRRADRLRDAGRDRGADRARALRPARQALSPERPPRAAAGADRADRLGERRRLRRLRAAGGARLPAAGDRSGARGDAAAASIPTWCAPRSTRCCSPPPRPWWRSCSASAP